MPSIVVYPQIHRLSRNDKIAWGDGAYVSHDDVQKRMIIVEAGQWREHKITQCRLQR